VRVSKQPTIYIMSHFFANSTGFSTEVAFCSREGMFVGVSHTWCSCEVNLSSVRRNENVFTVARCSVASNVTKIQCGKETCASEASSGDSVFSLKACNGLFLCAGSQLLEHEREVGTSVTPFAWSMAASRNGCVALYSAAHGAFLRNDLSLHYVPEEPSAEMHRKVNDWAALVDTLDSCLWLSVPIPLKSEEGRSDGYYSATRLLHWGHDSAVLLMEHSSFRQPSTTVAKSIPCQRAPAIRRMEELLYQSNMPGSPDCVDLFCPLLSKMTSLTPSVFYVQQRCYRSLDRIFEEQAVSEDDQGAKRLPFALSLGIIRRVLSVVTAAHALGYLLLDATPSSFCEGESGNVDTLLLIDMKNVMKLEPKTYSTPASFVTKSGGRFGVPTGLFVMVPQPSLFLGHLHANCLFAAPEVLQTPGSVGTAADIFSVACLLVWCLTGTAPCALMSPQILALDQ
jgi:hypothetical protein